jgi:hypothetical protein
MSTKIETGVEGLELSLSAARHVLLSAQAPLQRRLAWLAGELERLAGEAYRLADEAGDDPESPPGDCWPGLDPEPKE